MLNSILSFSKNGGLSLLMLGAHCDDIEIGCGGTILKLIEEYEISYVKWIVFTSNNVRKKEAQTSAKQFLGSVENADIEIFDFKDGYLPSIWSQVKDKFEKIKDTFVPDLIFTHYRDDLHQDHRTLNELTWNTFRNHLIFEYEIPKYDGDLGSPNVFVPLNKSQIEEKKKILINSFSSQLDKQWFDNNLLTSVMRIRGVECASDTKYAEAFYCRKLTI